MKLEQLTAPSLRDLFVKTIQDAIISGELKIGEVLPTEREFAEQMNVSRSVVNSGLNELKNRGFIEIKPRKGAVVADYIYTGNINTLTALMEYRGIAFTKESVRSILEIRKFAELMVVDRICERVTDDDLSPFAQRDGAPDVLAGRCRRDGPDAFQGLGLQKAVDRDAVYLREPRRLFEVGRGLAVLPLRVCLAGDLDLFGDLLL